MARKVHVVLEDDIDGSEAAETVKFALDGRNYEIDLSESNAAALRDALGPWVAAARTATVATRAAGAVRGAGKAVAAEGRVRRNSAEIREWARAQGLAVSERGRISSDLVEKFEAAQ